MTTDKAEEVRARVRAAAISMLPGLPEFGAGTAYYIAEHLPETKELGAFDALLYACQANGTLIVDALIRDVPVDKLVPSEDALQNTRRFVQAGVSQAIVLRAYRIGAQYWLRRWTAAVSNEGDEDAVSVRVVEAGISFLLNWLEIVTERVAEEYQSEAARLAIQRSFANLENTRYVLEAENIDVDTASTRLGYRLRERHVAFVLRAPADENGLEDTLAETVTHLCAQFEPARPLAVRADFQTVWCWVPCPGRGPVHLPTPNARILAAQGRPAAGLQGFRQSHQEALSAMRVAEMADFQAPTTVHFEDVAVAALCSADPDQCRSFVASELGPLAKNQPKLHHLRETLQSFYANNCNFRATAANLGIHHNTVRYRLDQAEHLLGRSLTERRFTTELALHLLMSVDQGKGSIFVQANAS